MKKTIITALAILPLLACCGKAEWESAEGTVDITNPNPPERRASFVTFNATLEGQFTTKTSLDLDITRKLIWEKGDEVLVEDEDGKQAVYATVSGGSDQTTLTRFSGDTLKTTGNYKAWYPVSYKTDGLQANVWIEDLKSLRGGPMEAEGMRTLEFRNLCGVVRCSYNPASNFLAKKLEISAGQPLSPAGPVTCDLTRKSPSGMTVYGAGKNVFSFFIPEGTYTDFKAVFSADDNILAEITLEYDLNVTKGNIVNVDLNTPQGKQSNLNKYESANCYVISGVGEYYFSPTRVSRQAVDGISGVRVLWETDNANIEPDASIFDTLYYEGGKIYFNTPETYLTGNALIGAVDDGGNVLWSWHIWAVESAPGVQQYDKAGKVLLMDRSLGSLAAPTLAKPSNDKYACLLYQWGRKDPFPGFTTQGDRYAMEPEGLKMVLKPAPGTLAESIAHPEYFYYGDSLWCSDSFTGWSSVAKTDYDPCPVGYIVAPPDAFNETDGVFYQGYIGSTSKSSGGAYVFQNGPGGEYYGYPLSSCIEGMTGAKGSKSNNYIWTAVADSDSTALACMMHYGYPEGSSTKHPLLTTDVTTPMSSGYSVRCMRILEEE